MFSHANCQKFQRRECSYNLPNHTHHEVGLASSGEECPFPVQIYNMRGKKKKLITQYNQNE